MASSIVTDRAAALVYATIKQRLAAGPVDREPPDFPAFLALLTINDAHRGAIPFEEWPHLVELAGEWAEGQSQVVLKARQVGVSWLLAAYALYRAQYQASSVVLVLSQGQAESYELARKVRSLWESLPARLQRPLTTDSAGELAWQGGGRLLALPATQRAGRGYTATLVVADEAAYHPWAQSNYAAYKPALDGGGQFLAVSTANGATGFFHDLYWASAQGETPYEARFVPWYARPGRDEGWRERERRAFAGLPSEFDQEYPDTAAEAFVAHSGLVHVLQAHHVAPAPFGWAEAKWRIAGVDFGGGDPTAIVPLGISSREHVHQFGEFYRRGPVTTDDIYGYLKRLHEMGPLNAVLCDASEGTSIAQLRSMGIPALAADKDRAAGLAAVQFLLDNNRLTISPECKNSLHEFVGYRWQERVDSNSKDRYATATPVDHHADAMDARRYAVMYLMRSVMARGEGSEWRTDYAN